MRKNEDREIVRYNPSLEDGLLSEQVNQRKKDKLINETKIVVGKTYWQIILTNVFSFFNILLFVIAGLMIFAQYYSGLLFLVVLIPNIVIGLYEDIKARRLMGKLRVVTAPKVVVIRDKKQQEILTSELVLDDITYLTANRQICADSIVIDGKIAVNEALLTGESENVYKNPGDVIYSGSYVVSGNAYARVDKVGADSYIETIQDQAKKFKRSSSEILKSLKGMFRVIGVVVSIFAVTTVLFYYFSGRLASVQDAKNMIRPLSGSLVSMIPAGLYLLTSLSLAVGVIGLAQKKAHVQDFYSIEMLSRTNVLCVDKTGTITDGSMEVSKVIPFNKHDLGEIESLLSNVIKLIGDDNATAQALLKRFTLEATMKAKKVLNFDSKNKYSGVTLSNGKTYVLGAAEFLNLSNKKQILKEVEEYSTKGLRVLIFGESNTPIVGNEFNNELSPVAMIVIQDHIKPDAYETFRWFKENDVAIKVISGDNAATVSEIARQAGVDHAENYVSLEGMSNEEVKEAALNYSVFGRVTPEQKAIIVSALKEANKTVAMTGDGVNDILALKKADCSIAMASGADSAKNVSHIVLLDSNFSHLPDVVGEGRRVVNNLQRTSSLFLVKTIFAVVMSLIFLIASIVKRDVIPYPFSTNNMYLWEFLAIGIPAFCLALQKNNERIRGSFLPNVFRKAVPAGAVMILMTVTYYLFFLLQKNGVCYFGINTAGFAATAQDPITGATAMACISFTIMSLVVLYKVCVPFDKFRKIIFGSLAIVYVIAFTIFAIISIYSPSHSSLIQIDFTSLSLVNYLTILSVFIGFAALYFLVTYIIELIERRKHNDKN